MDYHNLDVAEAMATSAVDRIADPIHLVDRALKRRSEGHVGIKPPWSKLAGNFAFRPGELVLFGGYSGHGKSTVINQMALHAVDQGYRVGMASLELPAEYLLEQFTEMAATVPEPPESFMTEFAYQLQDRMYIFDHVDSIAPMDALKMIIAMRKYLGCDLIVLDCLFMVNMGDELEQEKLFSQKLAAIAKAFDVCIVVVHHLRKPQGREGEKQLPGKMDFIGSSHLVNVSSSVVLVWADKELQQAKDSGFEYDPTKPDVKLIVAKQRYYPWEGIVGLYRHKSCRLLCNNSQRMYRPFTLKEKKDANGEDTVFRGNDFSYHHDVEPAHSYA